MHLEEHPPWRQQLLAITLVDLLGRVFSRIDVRGGDFADAHELLPPGPGRLRDRLEAARRHGVDPLAPGDGPLVSVVVGSSSTDGQAIYCDGDGWQSYLGPRPSRFTGAGDEEVPIGPLASACRAAAHAFAMAVAQLRGAPRPLDDAYWSALTLRAEPQPFVDAALDPSRRVNAVLGGAGSIGGAAAYAFARVPGVDGELHVVDPQSYEPHNPDRAILATEALAASGAGKAQSVADGLDHQLIQVHPFRGTFEQWVGSRPRGPLPLALCAFDSIESRRELQDSLPLEVVNAACGEDHIAVSGHRTGDGACVYCLHVPEVLDTERITFKLIVQSTRLPPRLVQTWLEQHFRLDAQTLEQIARNRGLDPGALMPFVGCTLLELHRRALAYGEEALQVDEGAAAVAAPWVTALAGFILAAEALKAGDHERYSSHRLGPWTPRRTRYEESLYASARNAIVSPVPRWEGSECLCQSARRQRLLAERYGL